MSVSSFVFCVHICAFVYQSIDSFQLVIISDNEQESLSKPLFTGTRIAKNYLEKASKRLSRKTGKRVKRNDFIRGYSIVTPVIHEYLIVDKQIIETGKIRNY